MIELIEATDRHFAWLLSGARTFGHLTQAEGGVDRPEVLNLLRGIAAGQAHGMWLIVRAGEVCGLCGYMKPPAQGCAEIGYGVAPACRGQGLAREAVAAMLANAPGHGLRTLVAGTARDNRASQIVLERNGFSRIGTRNDSEDGEVIDWRWDFLDHMHLANSEKPGGAVPAPVVRSTRAHDNPPSISGPCLE